MFGIVCIVVAVVVVGIVCIVVGCVPGYFFLVFLVLIF